MVLIPTLTCVSIISYRGYTGKKLEDNVQCEIFQTILEEAVSSYLPSIVFELQSNTPDDLESNLGTIEEMVKRWRSTKR